jgi:hypothetical protein
MVLGSVMRRIVLGLRYLRGQYSMLEESIKSRQTRCFFQDSKPGHAVYSSLLWITPAIIGLYILVWWRLVAQITDQGQNAYLAGQSI